MFAWNLWMIFNPFWITLTELLVVPGTSSTSPISAPDLYICFLLSFAFYHLFVFIHFFFSLHSIIYYSLWFLLFFALFCKFVFTLFSFLWTLSFICLYDFFSIDFNSISTHLVLFYAKMLEYSVHQIIMYIFLCKCY